MLTLKVGKMNKLAIILLLSFPLRLFALELKVGDILLQPLDCFSCGLIEAQEETIYSHVGMVVQTEPSVRIIEALSTVRELSLESFNSRTQKGQLLSVRRFQNTKAVEFIQKNKEAFKEYFNNYFAGLQYDHDFLWNNFSSDGKEKMYCSEMITKLLNGFMGIEIPVKRMRFNVNREAWIRYFKGNPPDGQWGNSPGDIERSELFYVVGEI
jgi:Permuted papain-like amidase enzyme, YaeF/YiiX, C92 family